MLTLLEARGVLASHRRSWWRSVLRLPGDCRACGARWVCPPAVEAERVVAEFYSVPLPDEWFLP